VARRSTRARNDKQKKRESRRASFKPRVAITECIRRSRALSLENGVGSPERKRQQNRMSELHYAPRDQGRGAPEARHAPDRAGRVPLQRQKWRGDLRRQREELALARAELLPSRR